MIAYLWYKGGKAAMNEVNHDKGLFSISKENLDRAKILAGIATKIAVSKADELTRRAKHILAEATDPDRVLERVLQEKYAILRGAGVNPEDAKKALLKIIKETLEKVTTFPTNPTTRR